MVWDELLAYCLAKPGAWQDEPWGDGIVAKVGPKIFAFLGPPAGTTDIAGHASRSVGLKCAATREAANEWLLRYPGDAAVMPYIGRSGWNSLRLEGEIGDDEILEAIDASYAMVVSKLPKKDRPTPPDLKEPSTSGFAEPSHLRIWGPLRHIYPDKRTKIKQTFDFSAVMAGCSNGMCGALPDHYVT